MTETDFDMVECFNAELNQCRMSQHCRLQSVLSTATRAYLAVLDGLTVADLVAPQAPGRKAARRRASPCAGCPPAAVGVKKWVEYGCSPCATSANSY